MYGEIGAGLPRISDGIERDPPRVMPGAEGEEDREEKHRAYAGPSFFGGKNRYPIILMRAALVSNPLFSHRIQTAYSWICPPFTTEESRGRELLAPMSLPNSRKKHATAEFRSVLCAITCAALVDCSNAYAMLRIAGS